MGDCNICGKKMGFLGGHTLEWQLTAYTSPLTITVCDDCNDAMQKLKKGDLEAYRYVHNYSDKLSDQSIRSFIQKWEKIPGEITEEKEKEKKREALEQEAFCIKKRDILQTTGYDFQGYSITQYLGVVTSEVVMGTGFLSELFADFSDTFGIQSGAFEDKLEKAKNIALDKLTTKCVKNDANGIIGISFNYVMFRNNMIGIIVNGTMVKVEKNSGLADGI